MVAGNLNVKASPPSLTQYSAVSPITLNGRGLLVEGTLDRVFSLTAGDVTDATYNDIHKGVLTASVTELAGGEATVSLELDIVGWLDK